MSRRSSDITLVWQSLTFCLSRPGGVYLATDSVSLRLEILKMIDWVPVVFVTFKVLIFGTCMFFAIKWHYDQGKKGVDRRALLRTSAKLAAIFLLALLGVLFFTFGLARMLGMDLSLP